jgi:hypothetical protein
LAEKAAVSIQTIKRFEAAEGVPRSRTHTLLEIKAALEAGGIEFIGTLKMAPVFARESAVQIEMTANLILKAGLTELLREAP